ncbi:MULTISPECIES: DUF4282 domain-containing protein [Thiomicrorhabdus]|uniref:DUF4282 domain-containing protein n=1 Tax=Thiomicrorhabdus heinhorstiae TaxID=2748010 RepID=A0ABS0BYC3_9GAMM|nr:MULTISPECIES: DUF4282 domain-containing protein [Thiomicrorhabdus]MBF6058800.1 DUF4282 domain-containing protein [Thiomicrorhabdus heinhorstiae]
MWDFLSFKRLISIEALIVFYYFGAIVLPIFIVWVLNYLRRKLAIEQVEQIKATISPFVQLLGAKLNFWKWWLLGIVAFLFAELFWRLLFEFLIAFMQMRDALVAST